MLLSTLLLTLLPFTAAAAGAVRPGRCLPSGDETAINSAFKKGGKGTTVNLCPGSVHRLSNPIVLTAPRQMLTTEGNPRGRERAMLIVEGEKQAIAVLADCTDCSWATIRSLVVDGNRPQLLRVPLGGALIELGNAEGQTIRDCRLYEPRGWSALHFREGDRKQCTRGHIVDNEIGPCGEEWDDEYDGVVEKTPPYGNPRADGISLACQESLVERNTVFDATDGAIVLFGSAGSEVRENEVFSRTRVVLGGINLVDYDPWDGDYDRVNVHHNKLYALSRYLKVGIVIGPSSWSDDTDSVVHLGSVTDNSFYGDHFGYGIVVSSATGFTVLRNTVDDTARFSGIRGPRCPRAPENGKPTAFLINRGSARGVFQEDFVNGEVQHIICLNPVDENGKPYRPWRLRDSPEAIADKAAKAALEHPESVPMDSSGFDGRLAEAFVNYQTTLLGAMQSINDHVDAHILPGGDDSGQGGNGHQPHKSGSGHGGSTVPEINGLNNKIDKLETAERRLHTTFEALRSDLDGLSTKLLQMADDQKPLLESVFRSVTGLQSARSSRRVRSRVTVVPPKSNIAGQLYGLKGLSNLSPGSSSSWGKTGIFIVLGLSLLVAVGLIRRIGARHGSTNGNGGLVGVGGIGVRIGGKSRKSF